MEQFLEISPGIKSIQFAQTSAIKFLNDDNQVI